MKIYTVERMNKYDYDFYVNITKHGCFTNKEKAIQRARQVYESMCGEYEDEMVKYSDEDCYEDVASGKLYVEEDAENGYYFIAFGFEKDYECHSVAVEEWELDDEQDKIHDDEWFGQVRWCDEDLENALEMQGYPATENNIEKLRAWCNTHGFTDDMIEAGWKYMYNTIGLGDGWDE